MFADFQTEGHALPDHVRDWLLQRIDRKPAANSETTSLGSASAPNKLELLLISQIGSDEILLCLVEGDPANDQLVLHCMLALTQRESEVLLWIARGKSNRDIADILTLSPRTVNSIWNRFSRSSVLKTERRPQLWLCGRWEVVSADGSRSRPRASRVW